MKTLKEIQLRLHLQVSSKRMDKILMSQVAMAKNKISDASSGASEKQSRPLKDSEILT
jgi:hypothetical protein